jgi:hypothetical protein
MEAWRLGEIVAGHDRRGECSLTEDLLVFVVSPKARSNQSAAAESPFRPAIRFWKQRTLSRYVELVSTSPRRKERRDAVSSFSGIDSLAFLSANLAATPGWSLLTGIATWGTPWAKASSTVFNPACVMQTDARVSNSNCGALFTRMVLPGRGPISFGSR